MSDYQLLVIGAGPGGYIAALRAAKLGLKTAVVENREVGGTCLNRGCIPTKSLLHSADILKTARSGEKFGVTSDILSFNFSAMHTRKNEVIDKLRTGILQQFKAAKVDLLSGTGTLLGEGRVRVTGAEGAREYSADHVLLATGSVPSRPPIPGLDLPNVVTSDELLSGQDGLIGSLVIIGGGVIGVELASFYAELGTKVVIVEALERILPTMDREISQSAAMLLKKRGIEIHTGCRVERIASEDGALTVHYTEKDAASHVCGEKVLCAIGRRPYTEGLFGPDVPLKTERGRIVVNERFETSVPNVYAVGDVSSVIQLAHVASAQGTAAAEALAGKTPLCVFSAVPACIYTDPEIACVGLTADEAKAQGRAVKTGKCLMSANGRTVILDGERGFIKLVADAESSVILGAQLMCERATDMIGELVCAVANGLTADQLKRAIRPHPTFGEAVSDALDALK